MSRDRTVKAVVCRDVSHEQGRENQRDKTLETNRLGLSWIGKKEQILADCQAEIRKHEFQAANDRRSIQKLGETIDSQQEELHRAQAEERRRQDHQLLHEQVLKQNLDFREGHEKCLKAMEELKKDQSSTFDTIARRRLVEDQDTFFGTHWHDTGIAK